MGLTGMDADQKKFAEAVLGRADALDAKNYHRSQESTQMGTNPLKSRVRNILGAPPHDPVDMDGWTPDQRRDAALVEIAGDIDNLHDYGCGMHEHTCVKIERLERWRTYIVGALAGFGVIGSLITIVAYVYEAAHAH